MSTANVIVSRSGTGFTIDVTACDLLDDLTIKDFFILHNGTPYSPFLTDYQKTSRTVLTYTGASLISTTVEVRRKTPSSIIRQISFGERMSSDLWNKELDRKTRWQEEADINGVGAAFNEVIPTPQNDPYGVVWSGDTVFPPSRKVVYDKLETMAPLASPALTGNPTAPTQSPGNNSTRLATTAYVDAANALKANLASPALTGTPTAPTAAATTNTTQIATTAHVKSHVRNVSANEAIIGNVRMLWSSTICTSTNSFGDSTLSFGTTLNNLITIVCTGGDGSNLTITPFGVAYGSNLSSVNINMFDGTSAVTAGNIRRVNWIAYGTI